MATRPDGFPSDIAGRYEDWTNWSRDPQYNETGSALWTVEPRFEVEIVRVANWASKHDYRVRVAFNHVDAPIVVDRKGPQDSEMEKDEQVIILRMTSSFNNLNDVLVSSDGLTAVAKAEAGMRLFDFLDALEKEECSASEIGWRLPTDPSPVRSQSLGELFAVDGCGSGIAASCLMGVRAVVYNKVSDMYEARDFYQGQNELLSLGVNLGRALITEVFVMVVPNSYVRCRSIFDISAEELFAQRNEPSETASRHLTQLFSDHRGVEVMWFPFSENPWVRVWDDASSAPTESTRVYKTPEYGYTANLSDSMTDIIRGSIGGHVDPTQFLGHLTDFTGNDDTSVAEGNRANSRSFSEAWAKLKFSISSLSGGCSASTTQSLGQLMADLTVINATKNNLLDIYGTSKNALLRPSIGPLRFASHGFAVVTSLAKMETIIGELYFLFKRFIAKYREEEKFPVNGPFRLRFAHLEPQVTPNPDEGVRGWRSPNLSAFAEDEVSKAHGWKIAVVVEIFTLPNTPWMDSFLEDFEDALLHAPHFHPPHASVRPLWGSGWACSRYTGSWSKPALLNSFRAHVPDWHGCVELFKQLDPKSVFTNNWVHRFMRTTAWETDEVPSPTVAREITFGVTIPLTIRVLKASDLLDRDTMSKSDPYIRFFGLKDEFLHSTRAVENCLDPEFPPEAKVTIPIRSRSGRVRVQLWDSDTIGHDEILGEAVLHIVDAVEAARRGVAITMKLKPRAGEKDDVLVENEDKLGSITFRVSTDSVSAMVLEDSDATLAHHEAERRAELASRTVELPKTATSSRQVSQARPASSTTSSPRRKQLIPHGSPQSVSVDLMGGTPIDEEGLYALFTQYDTNNNGVLEIEEFKRVYQSLEWHGLKPTDAEINRIFNPLARNGKLTFEGFCLVMLRRAKM